jgi:hypothetical protein
MSPGIRRPFKPDGCTSLHVRPVLSGRAKFSGGGRLGHPDRRVRTATVDKLAIKMISL